MSGWRAGENAPAWARGKTPDEILAQNVQLYGALEQVYRNPPQAPSAPPVQNQAPNWATLGDDDVVSGRDLKALVAQAGQQIGQNLSSLYGMQGDTNLSLVQAKHKDVFEKYGHEVMRQVASLPVEMRTQGNLETIVKLVKSDHFDELLDARAREMASQQDPTMRSTGGSGSGQPGGRTGGRITERDDIPAQYREMMARKGITDDTVREFAKANGETVDQWLEKAKRYDGNLITERSVKRGGTNG